MEVFVIPVAADRYELYGEQPTDLGFNQDAAQTGMLARTLRQFSQILRDVEAHEAHTAGPGEPPKGLGGRLKDTLLSWIAERIVEQRLLWNLRGQAVAEAVHPGDMAFDDVLVHIRRGLQRDYERHRFWLVVDTVGLVLMGVLAPIPGPNLLAYYFVFRVGGHWLSMRGAAQGRHRTVWSGRACPPLESLRDVWRMDPGARQQRVLAVATELRLPKLPKFVDRVVRAKRHDRGRKTE